MSQSENTNRIEIQVTDTGRCIVYQIRELPEHQVTLDNGRQTKIVRGQEAVALANNFLLEPGLRKVRSETF